MHEAYINVFMWESCYLPPMNTRVIVQCSPFQIIKLRGHSFPVNVRRCIHYTFRIFIACTGLANFLFICTIQSMGYKKSYLSLCSKRNACYWDLANTRCAIHQKKKYMHNNKNTHSGICGNANAPIPRLLKANSLQQFPPLTNRLQVTRDIVRLCLQNQHPFLRL